MLSTITIKDPACSIDMFACFRFEERSDENTRNFGRKRLGIFQSYVYYVHILPRGTYAMNIHSAVYAVARFQSIQRDHGCISKA